MTIYQSKILEIHIFRDEYFCSVDLRLTLPAFNYYENIQDVTNFIFKQDENLTLEQAIQLTKLLKEYET